MYRPDPVEDLARLVTHLMEHIDNLIEASRDRYQCPDHPNAPVWFIGEGHSCRAQCGWTKKENGIVGEWCQRELQPLPF